MSRYRLGTVARSRKSDEFWTPLNSHFTQWADLEQSIVKMNSWLLRHSPAINSNGEDSLVGPRLDYWNARPIRVSVVSNRADFLYQEIYQIDGVRYNSRQREGMQAIESRDRLVQAVLHVDSRSNDRKIFVANLVKELLLPFVANIHNAH